MKIITENDRKNMKIIRTYENHLKRNENHKENLMNTMKIKRQYQNHMKRNENQKRKSNEKH